MKAGWKIEKLGNLASYVNGYPFKPTDWGEKGLPIIRIQNLNSARDEYHYFNGTILPRYKVFKGDILISWSASLGVFTWNGPDALLNQHIFKVVFDKEDIDKEFFVYAVSFKLDEMKKLVHGATMQHITRGKFDSIDIPLPPLPEQKRIVAILDQEFAKIDALKANAEKSLQAAKDLFQATLKKELEPKKGWNIKPFGELCDIFDKKRKPISKRDREPGPYPYYGASCIQDYVKDYLFDGRYLLIGEDGAKWGPGDDTAYIVEGKFWVNNHAHIVKAKEGFFDDYLRYYIKQLDLNPLVAGAIIPKLTQEKLVAIEIPVPPLWLQQEIVSILDDLNDKCNTLQDNYQKTLALCDDLKQALLRKAFNGEL